MKKILSFMLALTLLAGPTAFAGENIWDMANSDQYGKKAGGMLGRGLVNAASCFVDLVVQTVEKTKQGPPFVGTLTGIGGGAACTVLRAGSGIVDVASFWVPGFNGVPVSRSYSNCLEVAPMTPQYTQPAAAPVYEAPQPTVVQAPEPAPVVVEQEQPRQHDPMRYVKK